MQWNHMMTDNGLIQNADELKSFWMRRNAPDMNKRPKLVIVWKHDDLIYSKYKEF